MSLSKTFDITSPVDGTTANTLETVLQDLKIAVRERVELEHEAMDGADAGKHKPGEVSVISTSAPTVNGGLGIDTYLKSLIDGIATTLPVSLPFQGYIWPYTFTPQTIVAGDTVQEEFKVDLKKGLVYQFASLVCRFSRNAFSDSYYTLPKYRGLFRIFATGFNDMYGFGGGDNWYYDTQPTNRNYWMDKTLSNIIDSQNSFTLEKLSANETNKTVRMSVYNMSKYHSLEVLEYKAWVINIPATNIVT